MRPRGRVLIVTVTLALAAIQSHATGLAPNREVPELYARVASTHGIPVTLFYAIALAESGKHVTRLNSTQPWPWTLNIEGEGRYFPSREAAVEAASEALASGIRSVDIGLLQVNWGYHEAALRSVESAIDPVYNLKVGARILADCYRMRGDWWSAVGCYHAPANAERAARYRDRVGRIWTRLTTGESL